MYNSTNKQHVYATVQINNKSAQQYKQTTNLQWYKQNIENVQQLK
jgi:hypothetical protein